MIDRPSAGLADISGWFMIGTARVELRITVEDTAPPDEPDEDVEVVDDLDDDADDDADDDVVVVDGDAVDDARDPRLPDDATSFWLVHEYGPTILDDTTRRVATMVDGLADDSPVADALNLRLVQDIEAAGIPAYLYVAPFSPEALAEPELADAARQVEAYWTGIASCVESPFVEIESGQLSARFADRARYFDLVHMADAGPFADVLVHELCANWRLAHPGQECS